MRCRCGNELRNVPEHLQGLASWVCQQCTNAAPTDVPESYSSRDSFGKNLQLGRKKKAA